MTTTGRRWTREQTHPMWCDVLRCQSYYADPIGGHRSEPMVAQVPEFGRVVMTLVQYPGRPAKLEVTLAATVPDAPSDRQRIYAEQLLEQLAATAERVALFARADSPPRRPAVAGQYR